MRKRKEGQRRPETVRSPATLMPDYLVWSLEAMDRKLDQLFPGYENDGSLERLPEAQRFLEKKLAYFAKRKEVRVEPRPSSLVV
jgi:hypothetical protein